MLDWYATDGTQRPSRSVNVLPRQVHTTEPTTNRRTKRPSLWNFDYFKKLKIYPNILLL